MQNVLFFADFSLEQKKQQAAISLVFYILY